jgi:hypothetical protein
MLCSVSICSGSTLTRGGHIGPPLQIRNGKACAMFTTASKLFRRIAAISGVIPKFLIVQ